MSSKDLQRDFSGEYGVEGMTWELTVRCAQSESGWMEQAWRSVLPDTPRWGWPQK